MKIIDGEPAKQKIIELKLEDFFSTGKDRRIYDNNNLRVIVFWGKLDKFNRQRKEKDRGFLIIECSDQLKYEDALKMVLKL
jgi:hypothetical protein